MCVYLTKIMLNGGGKWEADPTKRRIRSAQKGLFSKTLLEFDVNSVIQLSEVHFMRTKTALLQFR